MESASTKFGPSAHSTKKKLIRDEVILWWTQELFGPLESFLLKSKCSPNILSLAGFGLTCFGSLFLALGWFLFAAWVLALAASFDFIDGRVARNSATQSRAGSFLDSTLDRYADAVIFFALAVFFRESWLLWIVLIALLGSLFTSYIRAKAESLQVECRSGMMQRPERLAFILMGALLTGFWRGLSDGGSYQELALLPMVLAIFSVAILSHFVSIGRFVATFRALK